MSNNKISCIHITRKDIRLVEGRVGNGVVLISRTALIENGDRFFRGERLAFLKDLVQATVNAMVFNGFTAHDLHIVYDNKAPVDFYLDEKLISSSAKTSTKTLLKKKGSDSDSAKKNSGTISHKKGWGQFITETEQGELYTTTHMERDLVDFLLSEYREHGYRLKSIETPETAIIYLRALAPYSYDAINKLVVYANDPDGGWFYQFTKDAPASQKQFHFDTSLNGDLPDMVLRCIQEEIQKSNIHSPQIILLGDLFNHRDFYVSTCDMLRDAGHYCLDPYGLWNDPGMPLNSMRVVTPVGDDEIIRDGRYGLCICLLLRCLEKKPENMIEGFHLSSLNYKTKSRLTEGFLTISLLLALYGLSLLGISLAENHFANTEYRQASTISSSQLAVVQSHCEDIRKQVDVLATIDHRYNDIFQFVYAQTVLNENINIASIDTIDMLPSGMSTSSAFAPDSVPAEGIEGSSETDSPEVSESAADTYEMKTIVIRGYSRTTEGPVELYRALVDADLGETKIIGVEQVALPSDEAIFAFEMTVSTKPQ